MLPNDWIKEFQGAVTLCDPQGIILEMNDKSAETFAKDGGRDLIGKNLLDCHPEPARSKLAELLREQRTNVYTIEKNGVKKMIYQSPVYHQGHYTGFIEMALLIPFDMPHFVRK